MTTNAPPSRDPADDDSLLGAFRTIIRKVMQNTEDMLPARVLSHDRANNRVRVQPLIALLDTNGNVISRDAIDDIPVFNLGGGGMFINFNLPEGSLGWIKASDRDISLFLQSYRDSQPNTRRLHSFSDSVFFPDVMTGYTIAGEDAEAMVIQNLDGSVKIALDDNQIRIVNDQVRLEVNGSSVSGVAPGGFNLNGFIINDDGSAESPVSVTAPLVNGTTNVTFGGVSGTGHVHPQGPDSAGDTQSNTGVAQ